MSKEQQQVQQPTEVLQSLRWDNDALSLLDQRLLPEETVYLRLTTPQEVWESIRELKVRGAPAIGIAAAYGVVLGVAEFSGSSEEWLAEVKRHAEYLATSRPTAVNLFWALDRMKAFAQHLAQSGKTIVEANQSLLAEARLIQEEDEATNRLIGEHALTLFQDGMGVLTHCNAGVLRPRNTARHSLLLLGARARHQA